jgi:peptidyl-prolyl cis-trans isomerase SurA
MPIQDFIRQEYDQYVAEECIAYKDARLEKEYPEFRALMQEYHDGILLFELTEKKVWNRASQDTAGLEAFFNERRQDYMWGERLHYSLFRSSDTKALEKARKMALKAFKKGQGLEDIPGKINKGEESVLSLETMKYEKGHPNLPATLGWERGITEIQEDGDTQHFYAVYGKVAPEPKALQECRGLATADYQTYLEKEWLKDLRNSYPVQVFPEVLDQVK